jgi:MSHA biogenesis protein MshK
MVEYLMIKTTKQPAHPAQHQLTLLLTILFGMAIILAMHTTQADTLRDPTQPPAALYSNADSGGPEVATAPVLQSVMIGPQYRAAIINGQKVLLGQKYEQATLIRLNEHEAVLRNPDMTTQTLVIDYAMVKKIVSPAAVPLLVKVQPTKSQIKNQVKRSSKTE